MKKCIRFFVLCIWYTCNNVLLSADSSFKTTAEPDSLLTQSYQKSLENISIYSQYAYKQRRKNAFEHSTRASKVVTSILSDMIMLQRYLFTWDTVKLLAVIVPSVLATRQCDDKIHSNFYDHECHKNKNQVPGWVCELARVINGPIIALLGIEAFLSKDEDFRLTCQAMLVGVPFLIYVNQAIKKLRCDMSLRPWNGNFSCEERVSGGFPSGHVSKATYLAVLYGVRYGPKFAIPLSLLAAFTGTVFVISNRHYASQIVAGIGFGAAYALAADKLVSSKLTKNVAFDVSINKYGGPAVAVSYNF